MFLLKMVDFSADETLSPLLKKIYLFIYLFMSEKGQVIEGQRERAVREREREREKETGLTQSGACAHQMWARAHPKWGPSSPDVGLELTTPRTMRS